MKREKRKIGVCWQTLEKVRKGMEGGGLFFSADDSEKELKKAVSFLPFRWSYLLSDPATVNTRRRHQFVEEKSLKKQAT